MGLSGGGVGVIGGQIRYLNQFIIISRGHKRK